MYLKFPNLSNTGLEAFLRDCSGKGCIWDSTTNLWYFAYCSCRHDTALESKDHIPDLTEKIQQRQRSRWHQHVFDRDIMKHGTWIVQKLFWGFETSEMDCECIELKF